MFFGNDPFIRSMEQCGAVRAFRHFHAKTEEGGLACDLGVIDRHQIAVDAKAVFIAQIICQQAVYAAQQMAQLLLGILAKFARKGTAAPLTFIGEPIVLAPQTKAEGRCEVQFLIFFTSLL